MYQLNKTNFQDPPSTNTTTVGPPLKSAFFRTRGAGLPPPKITHKKQALPGQTLKTEHEEKS